MTELAGDQPDYGDDGVDLTLIRWMLSLTATERLKLRQRHVNSVLKLRAALESDCFSRYPGVLCVA